MPRYIDADALRASALKATKLSDFAFDNCFPYWQFAMCIKQAPTADAVPVVRGEWGQCSAFDEDENVYTCSVCGEPWTLFDGTPLENNMHHCPNCGAKMEDKP